SLVSFFLRVCDGSLVCSHCFGALICLVYLLFFFHTYVAHPDFHSFPTRRSSDLHHDGANVANLVHEALKEGLLGRGLGLGGRVRSEEHTSELQSRVDLVCRLLLEKKKRINLNSTFMNE